MVNTRDIVLGIIGFLISFYGGNIGNLKTVILGLLVIFLAIILNIDEQQEQIKDLNIRLDLYNDIIQIKKDVDQNKKEIFQLKDETKKFKR